MGKVLAWYFTFVREERYARVVMDSLEEYLAGALEPAAQREVEAHLSTCNLCREEVQACRTYRSCLAPCDPKKFSNPRPVSMWR